MKIIRRVLGDLILFFNWVFAPKAKQRSPEEKSALQAKLNNHTLYEFKRCPFCVKVRREMKRLNIEIAQKDAKLSKEYEKELIDGGGKRQVPCLRIDQAGESKWMYESGDIINYLQSNFS